MAERGRLRTLDLLFLIEVLRDRRRCVPCRLTGVAVPRSGGSVSLLNACCRPPWKDLQIAQAMRMDGASRRLTAHCLAGSPLEAPGCPLRSYRGCWPRASGAWPAKSGCPPSTRCAAVASARVQLPGKPVAALGVVVGSHIQQIEVWKPSILMYASPI